jgi:hypothetical protein
MSVTNIITGRQIMESRATYNHQFGFHFATAAPHVRYLYIDEQGEQANTFIPLSMAEQHEVYRELNAHVSATIEIEGFRQRIGRISATPTERLDIRLSKLAVNELGRVYVQRVEVYASSWVTGAARFVYTNNEGDQVAFYSLHGVVNEFLASNPSLVSNGRDIYESMETRQRFGPAPELRGYHGPERSTSILSDTSVDWFVGIEVEKEDLDVRNRCAYANCDLGNGWIAEGDGSLDRQAGVEIVSPVMNLMDTTSLFAEYDRLDWVMNAGHSRRCGGHITISRKGMTSDQLVAKLMPFVPMLFSLYEGRLTNGYSGIQNKHEIERGSRRAIHRKSGGAVEIRIFSAVPSLEGIKFRTKLVQWIANAIDSDKYSTYTDVVDAMFNDKKLFKLLKTQYDNTKLRRKQALVYLFAGCLEDVSSGTFLNADNYERMLERVRGAYNSMSVYVRREVTNKFGERTIRKVIES